MSITYNLYRFGVDEFAVGQLINGDLPEDDEERWQILDAPRYRIQKLLDEHLRAQTLLRECRDSGKPFVLYLRSFSSEFAGARLGRDVLGHISVHSVKFQQKLRALFENQSIPILKLHGGSDVLVSDMSDYATVFSTHSGNWSAVAADLIHAASAIVFLVSEMTAGVVEEFDLIRASGRQDRCLIALLEQTLRPEHGSDMEGVRRTCADFPHFFELRPGSSRDLSYPATLASTLNGLLRGARTEALGEQALAAEFTYLEPRFLDSRDYTETEENIWQDMRVLRVLFEDTYWAALKSHGVSFKHLTLPGAWRVAHQLYGLGIAVSDFRAIREALRYLELLYFLRNADFALLIQPLASKYGELSTQIWKAGEPDTEERFGEGPDPLKLSHRIALATQLFLSADKQARSRDSGAAGYLYQLAVLYGLWAEDCDDRTRSQTVAAFCDEWAKWQTASGDSRWAAVNYQLSAALDRKLAAAEPNGYVEGLGVTLNNYGGMLFKTGDFPAAEATFAEALSIRRAAPCESENYLAHLHTSLANLALVHVERGKLDSARALFDEALATCEQRLGSEPLAIVDLTRLQGWMSLCLEKIPDAGSTARDYAQRAAANLATVEALHPEHAAFLRPLVDEAFRVTSA